MTKLYNVNLETNACVVHEQVEWKYKPVEEVIEGLRAAAVGLDNPHIDIDDEDDYDFRYYFLKVVGTRQLTESERANFIANREREAALRKHMQAFRG